jgi:hypothetical protein
MWRVAIGELREAGQALIKIASNGQTVEQAQADRAFNLSFSDMENAVNSTLGMLYLLAECLVPMVDNEGGFHSGSIAAGIGCQAGDCGSLLRSRFDELRDEYRRACGAKSLARGHISHCVSLDILSLSRSGHLTFAGRS